MYQDILALNADHSNRDKSLNNIDKLSKGIVKLYDIADRPTILVISEATATLCNVLSKKEQFKNMDLIHTKIGYDYIITGYNCKQYELLEVSYSVTAKCQSMVLEDRETNQITLFTGVHHPHKKGKREAVRLTGKIIDDYQSDGKYEIDHCSMGGDFNSPYEKVIQDFGDLNLNCSFNGEVTTINNTFPDNILYSDSLRCKYTKVHYNDIKLSHHPINSLLKVSK